MHVSSTARRYGRALAKVAIERRSEKTVGAELQGLQAYFASAPLPRMILESPASTDQQKARVLDAIEKALGGSPHPMTAYTKNTLRLMVENRRFHLLAEVVEAYRREVDRYNNVVVVDVTVPEALTADQRRDLEGMLKRTVAAGGEIRLEPDPPRVDPRLIGGFVARVGSTTWDGSLSHQLDQLKNQLIAE